MFSQEPKAAHKASPIPYPCLRWTVLSAYLMLVAQYLLSPGCRTYSTEIPIVKPCLRRGLHVATSRFIAHQALILYIILSLFSINIHRIFCYQFVNYTTLLHFDNNLPTYCSTIEKTTQISTTRNERKSKNNE